MCKGEFNLLKHLFLQEKKKKTKNQGSNVLSLKKSLSFCVSHPPFIEEIFMLYV